MNIYEKLLTIQKAIKGFGKDKDTSSQYNPKGYKYVTGDKVLEHIKPMINDLGLLLKQEILSIENIRQDYTVKSGQKSEILSKVMMKFTWVDCQSGEKDENLFGANGQNDWDKGVGSALTYGERYFLLKYFHIATDEDDIDNPDRKQLSPEEKVESGLKEVNDLTELTKYWNGLTPENQANKAIVTIFGKRKAELTKKAA
jgi:hypothetical protein